MTTLTSRLEALEKGAQPQGNRFAPLSAETLKLLRRLKDPPPLGWERPSAEDGTKAPEWVDEFLARHIRKAASHGNA